MSPPDLNGSSRGVSTANQSESASTVKVLSPSGVPLPDRITMADALQRITAGLARDITPTFRKQVRSVQLIAGAATPKDFGQAHWQSGRHNSGTLSRMAGDASQTTSGRAVSKDHINRRCASYGGLVVPVTVARH